MLLAVGTSLQVYPVAGMVPGAKENGARIIIVNAEDTPFDGIADAIFRQPISGILPALCGCAVLSGDTSWEVPAESNGKTAGLILASSTFGGPGCASWQRLWHSSVSSQLPSQRKERADSVGKTRKASRPVICRRLVRVACGMTAGRRDTSRLRRVAGQQKRSPHAIGTPVSFTAMIAPAMGERMESGIAMRIAHVATMTAIGRFRTQSIPSSIPGPLSIPGGQPIPVSRSLPRSVSGRPRRIWLSEGRSTTGTRMDTTKVAKTLAIMTDTIRFATNAIAPPTTATTAATVLKRSTRPFIVRVSWRGTGRPSRYDRLRSRSLARERSAALALLITRETRSVASVRRPTLRNPHGPIRCG